MAYDSGLRWFNLEDAIKPNKRGLMFTKKEKRTTHPALGQFLLKIKPNLSWFPVWVANGHATKAMRERQRDRQRMKMSSKA